MIEYFLANLWQVWAIVAVICLILELSSGDFFIICFSIGAVFAIIASVIGLNFYWQLFVFAIFSLLSVLFVRPVALRWLDKNEPNKPSNADALLGRIGFIDAVSHRFCDSCNRVRLTSTGQLKPCLCFDSTLDLRALLRGGCSDEQLQSALRDGIFRKPRAHRFDLPQEITEHRIMSQIGG